MDNLVFRSFFPSLQKNIHFANCSLAPASTEMHSALGRMLNTLSEWNAWHPFEEELTEVRAQIGKLIHAKPEEIAIMPNASIGTYQIASTQSWQSRNKIIITDAEFPSIAHVWLAQQSLGADITWVKTLEANTSDIIQQFHAIIDNQTQIISIPLVSYYSGLRLPVETIIEMAHAKGVKVMIDAYQAVGTEPIDMDLLRCDYLVAGTMKYLLGLPGLAFIFVRKGLERERQPQLTGWFGRTNPFSFNPTQLDFPDEARGFETGTPSVPAIYAANAGLKLINQLDLSHVKQHLNHLLDYATDKLLNQNEHLLLTRNSVDLGAHLALIDQTPESLSAYLGKRNIYISPRANVARIAFHYFNTEAEIDFLAEQIKEYRRT